MRVVFLMSLPLAGTGCACFRDPKPWLGSPEHELVAAWGKPDQSTEEEEDGSKVLTWTALGDVCQRRFVVNSRGTVVSFSGQGF